MTRGYTHALMNSNSAPRSPLSFHTTSPWHANNIHNVGTELWIITVLMREILSIFLCCVLLQTNHYHINKSSLIGRFTHFISLSHLFPARTIGTRGRFFFLNPLLPPPVAPPAFNFVSRICSRNRIASSNVSLLSILNTITNRSPGIKQF